MFSEAYDTFEKILDIEATNQIAQHEMAELMKKLPPRNAFRMNIEEIEDVEPSPKRVVTKTEKLEISDTKQVPKLVQNIVIEEATPFDKLVPKEKPQRESLIMPSNVQSKKNSPLIQEIH